MNSPLPISPTSYHTCKAPYHLHFLGSYNRERSGPSPDLYYQTLTQMAPSLIIEANHPLPSYHTCYYILLSCFKTSLLSKSSFYYWPISTNPKYNSSYHRSRDFFYSALNPHYPDHCPLYDRCSINNSWSNTYYR